MADEPVSRILCRAQTALPFERAAIIPLVPVSLPGSSSLPEGSNEPGRLSPPIWPCTTRGFPCPRCYHRSGGLLPHLFTLAKRCVHLEDVPQVSLHDATVLRSAGGLFSVALSVALRVAQALACAPPLRPLALPGASPCQEVRSPQNEERASGRCPDFPPAQPSCDGQASDHPARPPFLLYRIPR